MTALLVAAALCAAMTGLGLPAVRRLGPNLTPGETWLAALYVGALPLAAAVQLVGWWDYSPVSMAAVLAASLAAAAWCLRPLPAGLGWAGSPGAKALAGLAAVLVAAAAVGAHGPASDHDTLRYHLALPRRDLELGHIRLWFGWSVYEFFPPLGGLTTRLAYALGGSGAAQLLNVAWSAAAAAAAGLLVTRLGGGTTAAWAGAVLFLSQRVVVNLSSAVTPDMQLAGTLAAALVVGFALLERRADERRLAVLLGLLLGAALLLRYQAAIAALLVLAVLAVLRRSPWPLLPAGLMAAALLAPVLLRNWAVTGNPVFPTFHPLFVPGAADLFARFSEIMAERTAPAGGLAELPWSMHIRQTAFDGMQFGFPFALAALPFAFARETRKRLACLAVWTLYVVAWWYTMPHLLRFHLPLLGVVAALTALGLARAGEAARRMPLFAVPFAAFVVIGLAVQSMFVLSTASHRLPPALGWVDPVTALEERAYVLYSLAAPCDWLSKTLKPGERYLALVNDPSAHCPQAAALHQLEPGEEAAYYARAAMPPLTPAEAAQRLAAGHVSYILEGYGRGIDDEPLVFAKHRYDDLLYPIMKDMTPLMVSPGGRIYDAAPVIEALRAVKADPVTGGRPPGSPAGD